MEELASPDSGYAELADEQPRSRTERRDQQVSRILEAAKICFVRSGFQGASMQQICAAAGMSPGALYRYFPSKEAIVEAICEADRREDAEIFSVVLSNPDVVEGVVIGAMAHITHMHRNGAAPLFAEICAESMRNETVEAMCMKCMTDVQDMFRGYLGHAIERGEIDPPTSIDTLLQVLMATAHGMALSDLPSQGVPLDQIETLVRASVRGMLRPTNLSRSA